MSKVQEIEAAEWDKQIAAHSDAGLLDELADEAIRDATEGRCRDL